MTDKEERSMSAPSPCAWWVPGFSEPLVGRGEKKPMLWPEAKPLYDAAALATARRQALEDAIALVKHYRSDEELAAAIRALMETPK